MWCTTQAGRLRCGKIQLLGTGGLWRHANVRRSISSIPSCFNAAPKRPRGQVTYRPYHTSFPTVSGAASSFQIFFDRISHDVLYIIARATFQKVLPPEFKLLQGYLLETNAKDSLDLKCALLLPPNHSLLVEIKCCEATACAIGAPRRTPSVPSSWGCRAASAVPTPEAGMRLPRWTTTSRTAMLCTCDSPASLDRSPASLTLGCNAPQPV